MTKKSQMGVSVCFEPFSVAVTSVDGYPTPSVEELPALSKSSFHQSLETMTDLQSYSMMGRTLWDPGRGFFLIADANP